MLLTFGRFQAFCEEAAPSRDPEVIFENANPRATTEGGKIIAEAARHFEEITQRKIGEWTIRISFEEEVSVQGMNLIGNEHLRGVTMHSAHSSTIRIAVRKNSNWDRVLAHEVVHTFVRATYGTANNTTLNEGLAEYVAAQIFPAEVRRDLYNAKWGRGRFSQNLCPYVEGYRFCSEHARDADFANFIAQEITGSANSYILLNYKWKLSANNQQQQSTSAHQTIPAP